MSTNFEALTAALTAERVQFIVIGGAAGMVLGAPRFTQDLDIVYERSDENLSRLVRSLRPFAPYLRGAPAGLPFVFDERTLRNGLNFTLVTTIGWIDLLGEVTGGGDYHALLPDTVVLHFWERDLRVVTLEKLIHLKRAAGRVKDLEAIAELELIRDELAGDGT